MLEKELNKGVMLHLLCRLWSAGKLQLFPAESVHALELHSQECCYMRFSLPSGSRNFSFEQL